MNPPDGPSSALPDAASRADAWRLRTQTLRFGRLPALMGIVNVTPDSFSDGGRFLDPRAAVDRGLRLVAEGAALLDIGGESTRPRAEPVAPEEELRRVLPVVQALCERAGVPISIDTSKAEVAREALAAGAEIVNDVTALTGDPRMAGVVAETGAGVCVVHMQGTPRSMQDRPTYRDVVAEVLAFLQERRDALAAAGIAGERIALDPGIGFGKQTEHNLALLAACNRFHRLKCPLLVGPSRKRFIREVLAGSTTAHPIEPLFGTIGVAAALVLQGVQVLRVHDIRPIREALAVFEAARAGGTANLR
jgi:dihydropteroate synthase